MDPRLQPSAEVYPERLPCRQSKGGDDCEKCGRILDHESDSHREQGFAFIETVIAAAIVATMLGVTLQTVTDDARRARAVEERRHAALVAQSVLASAGVLLEGADGETRGVSGGMRWRVDVRPYGAGERDASGRLDLVTVSVGPADHAGDLVALRTLRIGR